MTVAARDFLFRCTTRCVVMVFTGHGKRGVYHLGQEEVRAGGMAWRRTKVGSVARTFSSRFIVSDGSIQTRRATRVRCRVPITRVWNVCNYDSLPAVQDVCRTFQARIIDFLIT